ncbi:hypothetical protein [Methylobacterium sp. WCS2018Hpa-22]|uniref:hypothetical protein n=1 Tax=Methylobacterium sp. WCS2018Hpa-22 TaxID=3073633 RepID=UPI00288C441E|nr:hypothetical protein [Methylobacterium sp. WCS2018Hpa-22]
MFSLDTILGFGGTVAKALGAVTAVGSAYIALGLPLPATVAYVDGKISTVVSAVADVKVTILEGQLRDITSQRALLRNEKTALTRTVDKAPDSAKPIFARRMGEIEDALAKLTREEDTVTTKLAQGREVK